MSGEGTKNFKKSTKATDRLFDREEDEKLRLDMEKVAQREEDFFAKFAPGLLEDDGKQATKQSVDKLFSIRAWFSNEP